MLGCSVMGCKSNTLRIIEGISFHTFPNDPEIRKLWRTATNRLNYWDPPRGSRIYSRHFNKEDVLLKCWKENISFSVPVKESQSVNENVITQVPDSHQLQVMITEAYSNITNSDISTSNMELMTPNGAKNKNSIPHVPDPLVASFSQHTNASTISTNEALHIIMQRIGRIQEDIKTITENQLTLYENQNTLLLKFTEHQTQCKEFTKLSCGPSSASKMSDFEPIGSANELNNLEISLKDPDFSSILISKLELFCRKGKNRGISNAYAVIDILFQRKFLTNCSWTGGSRTDDSKIALKGYKNVFNLLFSVCHASDPNFNKPDCEKFLKTVLKNARQRCNSKMLRVSTEKRRRKRKIDCNAATSKRSRQVEVKESNIIDKEICTTGPSDNDNTTAEEEDSLC